MATEKETKAFVERVASRASVRNSYRATFVALRPLVEGALAAGYSMKTTWDTLRAEGKLTMTYETFRVHCRKAGLGQATREAVRPALAPRVRPQAENPSRPTAAPAATTHRADEQTSAFRHNAVPQKSEIYG